MSSDLVDGRGAVAFPTVPNDVTTGLSRSGSSTGTLDSLTVSTCGSKRKEHMQLPDKTRQGEPIHWERTHDLLDPACESPTGWMRFLRLKITNPASHGAWRRGPVPTLRCNSLVTRSRIGRVQYGFDLRPYQARCVAVSWGLAAMVPNGNQLHRLLFSLGKGPVDQSSKRELEPNRSGLVSQIVRAWVAVGRTPRRTTRNPSSEAARGKPQGQRGYVL